MSRPIHLRPALAAAIAGASVALARDSSPAVSIEREGAAVVVKWPSDSPGFVLETTDRVGADSVWNAVSDGVPIAGPFNGVRLSVSETTAYFRLRGAGPAPIVAPPNVWTWVPFPDAFCMDGSPTGIGVNLRPGSKRVLILLLGGGACWDETTCYILNTAVHGPYGETQFALQSPGLATAWIFDRNDASNPFKDHNLVVVPYCTGDLHAGSNTVQYGTHETRHVGYRNMTAYLKRLVPTFPTAERVVLSGLSTGGFGAAFNWLQTQQAFGSTRVDMIDDSGAILTSDALAGMTGMLGKTAVANWNLAAALPPGCAECPTTLDEVYAYHLAGLPQNRGALLAHAQDQTAASYYQLTPTQFGGDLLRLLQARFDPTPNLRYFVTSGSGHTFLGGPGSAAGSGMTLSQFLTAMENDDPAWRSTTP